MSFFARLRRIMFLSALVVGVALFSAGFGIASVVGYQVFFGSDAELEKSTIMARINEETTIYSADGQTLLGSFFDNAHRRYIPIEEVPPHMIRAVVAAEDKNFYNHVGIDPPAIIGAFVEGVSHGFKFRRGASTITQQTVKNIMGRWEHSFTRKFKEWVRALQLERMYTKSQILEFYLNQFHVTSNGNGIGIAAKYFFNKEVSELNLVEAAFIAGSVKAPSKYNPFLKYTKEAKEKAWAEADGRKNYVLKRMLEQKWITQAEYDKGLKERVPFNQGKFRTQEVALVSLIRGQLNRKEILESLGLESDDDLNNAGFKVYTTLDATLQKEAQLMVRRNLSRLDMILEGFKTETPDVFKPQRSLEVNQFYHAKVIEVLNKDKEPSIRVDFGLPKGVIPFDAIVRAAKIFNLPTYKGDKYYINEIAKSLKPGDVIFTEVKDYDPATQEAVLELRKRPRVNGGLVAVDRGEVRAVVAGFDSLGFNRAMFATRQPGSVFKSVIFFAALQLGWSILDRLDNERQVFPFQGQYYFPRPDHISPYSDVSMVWAGTMSENVATIYLTNNLLDKLNFEQFKALLGTMNLLPNNGEAPRDYHYRVARETGVQLDNEGVREQLLSRAINDLKPDLIFSGRIRLMKSLDRMIWGRGYQNELQTLYMTKEDDNITGGERELRIELLRNNFTRHTILGTALQDDWGRIHAKVKGSTADAAMADPETAQLINRFRVLSSAGAKPSLGYYRVLAGEEPPVRNGAPTYTVSNPGRNLTPLDVQAVWGEPGIFGESAGIAVDDVLLQGILPLAYLQRIKNSLEQYYQQTMAKEDKYSLDQYFQHHDFRIITGLRYLVNMTRAMGVTSPLSPVLSFGLGTNDVSAAEVAKVYQTFADGRTYRFYKEGSPNQLNFVSKIEDRDGNLIYQPKREESRLVDQCIASQMDEILRKVVTHGTGTRARGELYIEPFAAREDGKPAATPGEGVAKDLKVRIPAFGKTGTTNDFQTAYFAGFVPYPVQPKVPLNTENALVIASYVGYDFNKSMKVGGYRIYGGAGALPAWTDFAKAFLRIKKYEDFVDTSDINLIARQEWPLVNPECTAAVQVDLPRGSVLREAVRTDSDGGKFTNIEKEGESVLDEYARNPTLQALVRLALDAGSSARNPKRFFRPFNTKDDEAARLQSISTQGGGFQNQGNQPGQGAAGNMTPPPASPEPAGAAATTAPVTHTPAPPAAAPSSAAPAPAPNAVPAPAPASNAAPATTPNPSPAAQDKGYNEEELW